MRYYIYRPLDIPLVRQSFFSCILIVLIIYSAKISLYNINIIYNEKGLLYFLQQKIKEAVQ